MINMIASETYDVESAIKKLEQEDVKYLRLIIVDIHGVPKSLIIKKDDFEDALTYGVGFDGSSIQGYAQIENSDLIAIPDPSTLTLAYWEEGKTAAAICDVYTPEYKQFPGDPRFILKRIVEQTSLRNLKVKVGIELEYFIVNKSVESEIKPQDSGQCFDTVPMDYGDDLKKRLGEIICRVGSSFEKMHHEVAPGQHELSISATDPVRLADIMIISKLAVKSIARKVGFTATFMPKPFFGVNGSGAHVHVSLQSKEGKNLFYDKASNGLSQLAIQFTGGILSHAKGLSLLVAPLVNSYKRLAPGYEAPVYICWGYSNRSTLIRIPRPIREKTCRIEYRHPDPSFNPYLGLAAIIASGLDGIDRKLNPGEPCQLNVYHAEDNFERLPENLHEAIIAFENDETVKRAIGKHASSKIVELKKKEWNSYIESEGDWNSTKNKITAWEIQKYLERV